MQYKTKKNRIKFKKRMDNDLSNLNLKLALPTLIYN